MRLPHPDQPPSTGARSEVLGTLLQVWGTLSLASLVVMLYYGYVVLTLALSTGYASTMATGAPPPAELAEAALIQLVLMANYAIFKSRYRVVMGRAGIGLVLRSAKATD